MVKGAQVNDLGEGSQWEKVYTRLPWWLSGKESSCK